MKPRVISFMPVYNQAAQIGWVLDRFKPVLEQGIVQEVLAVDDGSTDDTPRILRDYDYCTVITHERRRGIGDAIRSAYRHALERDYDVFTIMAGNGKDDPMQIDRVLAPVLSGQADYVQGSRFAQGGVTEGLPQHRDLAIHVFTWTFSLFVRHRFTDCTNGFRAYRTSLLRDSRIDWSQDWLGSYELEYYMHYKAVQLGYRVTEVPVSKVYRRPSPDGSYSKMRARDWLIALKPLFYLRLGLRH
jgi:dolichol-phosphate mannosyltransferase